VRTSEVLKHGQKENVYLYLYMYFSLAIAHYCVRSGMCYRSDCKGALQVTVVAVIKYGHCCDLLIRTLM